jgi:hypothetical protein
MNVMDIKRMSRNMIPVNDLWKREGSGRSVGGYTESRDVKVGRKIDEMEWPNGEPLKES